MKKIPVLFFAAATLFSCSNATDGNPNTDTTTLTIDTGGLNDTANHINSNTSGYPTDTAPPKADIKSSTSTDAGSRSTTPVSDSTKKKY